jgi:hypothetical protein
VGGAALDWMSASAAAPSSRIWERARAATLTELPASGSAADTESARAVDAVMFIGLPGRERRAAAELERDRRDAGVGPGARYERGGVELRFFFSGFSAYFSRKSS